MYGIPKWRDKKLARLLFGNKYQFVVYHEYKNGWGLPLHPDEKNPQQLSVDDLYKSFVTEEVEFVPLENKKPVLLFATREIKQNDYEAPVKEDETPVAIPLSERESLHHLVVRSNTADDGGGAAAERHLLPEKISFEHAFWYGLLFKNMSTSEIFSWKRKYNCPFPTEKEYEGNCPEECSRYCGSTVMRPFYPESHIRPNYLADPSVTGITAQLYWDKDCEHYPVLQDGKIVTVNFRFGGTAGTDPKSYLLNVSGSEEVEMTDHDWLEKLSIGLKKGMDVWLKLTSTLTEDGMRHTWNSWWNHSCNMLLHHEPKNFLAKSSKNEAVAHRNIPRIVQLTHAVKEPVVSPTISSFSSLPAFMDKINHIRPWLLLPEFQAYQIGKNIIADRKRIDSSAEGVPASTAETIEVQLHFERLDAINATTFAPALTPSGKLELWMRKEQFIDDPSQIVVQGNSPTNHQPAEPVLAFGSRRPDNSFNLEYKIEYTNEIMAQLKDASRITVLNDKTDIFRSLLSKLTLSYDLKANRFEEREYYLKNVSKFKGFFTNEKLLDDARSTASGKLEEYTLPKIAEVMRHPDQPSEIRHKVMLLNNCRPEPVKVAFAITTIQETRSFPERKRTESVQKGNIVTIYLKRDRLTSGKNERVGIIVNSDNMVSLNKYLYTSPYNKVYDKQDLFSKAGRDIVSDRFSGNRKYLQYGDIVIRDIEGKVINQQHNPDMKVYYPETEYAIGYDAGLGIYHFLPHFDIEKQLWKIEVELDIKASNGKQLHNPFINFSLVHFQPFSINYNEKLAADELPDLQKDCRLSLVENSVWCYLLPERKVSVYFDKPNWLFDDYGDIDFTLSFDHESLNHFNYPDPVTGQSQWEVRSNFILTVQGSNDGVCWYPLTSWLDHGKPEIDRNSPKLHHALLSPEIIKSGAGLAMLKLKFTKWADPKKDSGSYKFGSFRIRLMEVEWFSDETWDDTYLLTADITEDERMRARYIELIY
ncbi:MAG: hypothetical protein J7578_22945 [Chitinophagaceae bacterium]|nr:hypothetical protein [Chitinophagaceae bacterium]